MTGSRLDVRDTRTPSGCATTLPYGGGGRIERMERRRGPVGHRRHGGPYRHRARRPCHGVRNERRQARRGRCGGRREPAHDPRQTRNGHRVQDRSQAGQESGKSRPPRQDRFRQERGQAHARQGRETIRTDRRICCQRQGEPQHRPTYRQRCGQGRGQGQGPWFDRPGLGGRGQRPPDRG